MQMMEGLIGGMFANIFAPPQQDTTYQQQLIQQQLEKQKQAAKKKQAIEQWKKQKREEESRMAEEEARKRQRGKELLSKMDGIGGGGRLEPFNWDTPELEAEPIGTGTYDTSGYTSWQRLLCASYFSSKALEASRCGDVEGAAFMNTQADRVTAGEMTNVECKLSGLQQLADVQRQNLKQNTRLTKMVKLMPMIQGKVKHLQEIEIKLSEVKKEKAGAEEKFETAKVKVEEAKVQTENARTPEEKTEADDLLQQALALQDEASVQIEKAAQEEKKYAGLREQKMEELKGIQEKITVESTGK